MLRRLVIRDLVIVEALDIELDAGFTVLTGETGAGKSILIDALQLALGARADSGLVREGAVRAEVSAEFDRPPALQPFLDEAGFADDDGRLLLRRSVDTQGKSRAWINGSPATAAQLRSAADALLDIHGQHAWQSLTRPAAVRALLDGLAGVDSAALGAAWRHWRERLAALDAARTQQASLERERERLAWQIAEVDKLGPAEGEWEQLDAEQQRLAHGQALIDAVRAALAALTGTDGDDDAGAGVLTSRAIDALDEVTRFDAQLAPAVEVLQGALAQLDDATHTLNAYLGRAEPDPGRLAELDARMAAWMSLARRWRRPPAELPALRAGWRAELQALDAAADVPALERAAAEAERTYREQAARASAQRRAAAPPLAAAVSAAMQTLGMDGGRFEVALPPADEPQAHGLESVEFLVAGHAGSTPRPLARVASGGELSRLALAIATTTATGVAWMDSTATGVRWMDPTATGVTCMDPTAPRVTRTDETAIGASRTDATAIDAPRLDSTATSIAKATPRVTGAAASAAAGAAADTPPTLIFDEIDAGIGGRVADSVGRLMQRLGRSTQVLAVTHLAQVAACADRHLVVTKSLQGAATVSAVQPVVGEARVAEIARMLGGERLAADTSRAHAEAMLGSAEQGR